MSLLHLQQLLGCRPLFWILGQSQFDKVVEIVCPVVQKKGNTRVSKQLSLVRFQTAS